MRLVPVPQPRAVVLSVSEHDHSRLSAGTGNSHYLDLLIHSQAEATSFEYKDKVFRKTYCSATDCR
jgi:hypothetical protein